jgi:hypothetical protein
MGVSGYVAAHPAIWAGLVLIGSAVTAYLLRLPLAK